MKPLAVYDLVGDRTEAEERGQLNRVLAQRVLDDSNSFECSPIDAPWPALILMVRGENAMVHYFSGGEVAGDQALGAKVCEGTISFLENTEGAELHVPCTSVVPAATAIRCVHEFAENYERPSCCEWVQL